MSSTITFTFVILWYSSVWFNHRYAKFFPWMTRLLNMLLVIYNVRIGIKFVVTYNKLPANPSWSRKCEFSVRSKDYVKLSTIEFCRVSKTHGRKLWENLICTRRHFSRLFSEKNWNGTSVLQNLIWTILRTRKIHSEWGHFCLTAHPSSKRFCFEYEAKWWKRI